MRDRPSLEEILDGALHEGPWWRHQPSLAQNIATITAALPVVVAAQNAVVPMPPDDIPQLVAGLAVAAPIFAVAAALGEIVYHRIRR